ncbi:MAG: pseudouridine synthase [Clostridia bacterium]|nr:pseudouridine synthase [Clostridia bacterium]
MRIDKYLSACGVASRSEIKKLVKAGKITVNGEVAKKAEMHIDENTDIIMLEGNVISYRKYVYLMLNKPQGYISAVYDKHYPVITELIDKKYAHFEPSPVGRLDLDTEGLIILTNDGDFNHNMTSPKKNVYKRYFARLDKAAEEKDIKVFEDGIEFKDFTTKPALLEITQNPQEVFIEIAEGKFHQVKRMCEHVGKTVVFLKRVAIGPLKLDETLATGESRELTEEEIRSLKELF